MKIIARCASAVIASAALSSVKPNFGLKGAAGAAGLLKMALALRDKCCLRAGTASTRIRKSDLVEKLLRGVLLPEL